MSHQGKAAAVPGLLQSEDLELISRPLGVTAATRTAWRDAFLAGGTATPIPKPGVGEVNRPGSPETICFEARIMACALAWAW
jgi:hypothetical protein